MGQNNTNTRPSQSASYKTLQYVVISSFINQTVDTFSTINIGVEQQKIQTTNSTATATGKILHCEATQLYVVVEVSALNSSGTYVEIFLHIFKLLYNSIFLHFMITFIHILVFIILLSTDCYIFIPDAATVM